MLPWALGFLIVALAAALFGFGRVAAEGSRVARICFYFFILGFGFSLMWSLVKRRKT